MASGTVGSVVTVVAIWLLPFTPLRIAGSRWSSSPSSGSGPARAWSALLGQKDPGVIVIDEVAGMVLSVLLLPRTIPVLVVAFLLFRLFDMWKPFPARESQVLTGGLGVMVDDLIAGVYALVLVMGARPALLRGARP